MRAIPNDRPQQKRNMEKKEISKEQKLKAAMQVVNKGILTNPRNKKKDIYRVPLQAVNGSATFSSEPNKEMIEAINELARIAYNKIK